jgi:hypothetical protein
MPDHISLRALRLPRAVSARVDGEVAKGLQFRRPGPPRALWRSLQIEDQRPREFNRAGLGVEPNVAEGRDPSPATGGTRSSR